jgi:hypothetical protein
VANTSAIGGAIGLGSNLSTASTSDQDISFLAAGNFGLLIVLMAILPMVMVV